MPSRLQHRGRHLLLLVCLLGSTSLPLSPALAGPWSSDPLFRADRTDTNRNGDRNRDRGDNSYSDWLDAQRSRTEQAYQQALRRLDQLERCLDRSRRHQDRDQCLRRDLEARERQWQRDQRDWQLLMRRQGRVAQLAWPLGY